MRQIVALALVLLTTGCAQFTHYRSKQVVQDGGGEAILVDAKQRAILSNQRPSEYQALLVLRSDAIKRAREAASKAARARSEAVKGSWTAEYQYQEKFVKAIEEQLLDGDVEPSNVALLSFCAEPSPDGLSAVSASGAFRNAVSGGASQAVQAALAESAGSIGLRTQSIQLMRDAMYRLCEGSMSGALGAASFETLHRRFQNSMVAILAIEQLTGAVRPPSIQLAGQASIERAEDVSQLTKMLDTSRTQSSELEAASQSAEADRQTAEQSLSGLRAELDQMIEAEEAEPAEGDAQNDPQELNVQLAGGEENDSDSPEIAQKRVEVANAEREFSAAEKVAGEARSKLEDKKKEIAYLERALSAARFGDAQASSSAFQEVFGSRASLDPEVASHVSKSVQGIVDAFYEIGHTDEVCTSALTAVIDGRWTPPADAGDDDVAGRLSNLCGKLLEAESQALRERAENLRDNVEELESRADGYRSDAELQRRRAEDATLERDEARRELARLREEKETLGQQRAEEEEKLAAARSQTREIEDALSRVSTISQMTSVRDLIQARSDVSLDDCEALGCGEGLTFRRARA